ncbi:MAG: hypothetical protein Q8L45_10975 [Xanthomonadaceae bacterium]|nr:hypothetical protein [Xanthomonadaceae bacterium]MDP2184472.1 hypothetical protein [Xanthomonadales bacterium]MDZ4116784.1 DUF6776 family protein [Xanthomonadaceae bacterium]MDZ4376861.1 DUF6776 family protein [Xanthomonadaceae bacterium]
MTPPRLPRQFVIVPSRPQQRLLLLAIAVLWLGSLLVVWLVSARHAATELPVAQREAHRLHQELQTAASQIELLRQNTSTLKRSDEISRSANQSLQQTLTEREEEIAQLRADVAFYERLVGNSERRKGLNVHSVQVTSQNNGAWHYSITLTQNLNRGKVSKGELRMRVDGTQNGRLQTLEWPALVQDKDAAAQAFAFRYFQQLEGILMLPSDFAPSQIRISLRSDGSTQEQAFPWQPSMPPGGG